MNKNDQITELKELLAVSDRQLQKNLRDAEYWEQRHEFQALREANRVKKAEAEAITLKFAEIEAKKQAEEDANLKSIRAGLIPIAVLRNVVKADYDVSHNKDLTVTTMEFRLLGDNKIHQAILNALLGREGGYTYSFDQQYASPSVNLSPAAREALRKVTSPDFGGRWNGSGA